MGGSAFSQGPNPLFTPRMPSDIYEAVKESCHEALRQLFICVATPIDGPGKSDFGDIDILVALEKRLVFPGTTDDHEAYQNDRDALGAVQFLLRSERAIVIKNQGSVNLAIPWPPHLLPDPDLINSPQATQQRYIQVDVRICKSIHDAEWMLFKHAHGDIWNILGSIIRPFGLTVDEAALWIRIPEIETQNRNRAKIRLTDDPTITLRFLDLPVEGFWDHPFSSAEAIYEYVATSRLFWVFPEEGAQDADNGYEDRKSDRKKLKSNDRKRMATRPLFRKWIDEFIPACRAAGRFGPPEEGMTRGLMRERIRADAFTLFPAAKMEYEAVLGDWVKERQVDQVWNVAIKGNIPEDLEPSYRGAVCSALKKIILLDDTSLGVEPSQPLKTPDGFWLMDRVTEFVLDHWETIGALAWRKQQDRYREHMEKKESIRKAKAAEQAPNQRVMDDG